MSISTSFEAIVAWWLLFPTDDGLLECVDRCRSRIKGEDPRRVEVETLGEVGTEEQGVEGAEGVRDGGNAFDGTLPIEEWEWQKGDCSAVLKSKAKQRKAKDGIANGKSKR